MNARGHAIFPLYNAAHFPASHCLVSSSSEMKTYLSAFSIINFIQFVHLGSYEITLEQVVCLNGTGAEGLYSIEELRVSKFNRTAYALNFKFETFFDVDENYHVSPKHHVE